MTYREFVVPDDDTLLETLGVTPEAVEGEYESVKQLRFTTETDEALVVTIDVLQRSVSLRWIIGGVVRSEIYREGAVSVKPEWKDGTGRLDIDFVTDELTGTLRTQIHPVIGFHDSMLLALNR